MVFSSINPLFQLDDPPYNWQQQQQPPAGRSVSDDINNDNRIPHTTPPPMPPPHGLSIRPDSMVLDQRPRLTKLPQRQQETAHKCPRCASPNTKFCYYNNYSLSQPRYFCKTCRRYWTKGGALRNVPVGGGLRRNKKSKRSRVKSPVTGNYSGVSSSSCTADNVLGPSVVPRIPLLPSLNFVSDHVEAENISSLSFRRIQPLTTTLMSDYIYNNQWRMQEFGFSAGLELTSAGSVYQFGNEGVAEVASADQYGSKTVEFCNPSQVDQLVKFEENDQGFMNLPKNFTSFQEYEHQQFCSNGDASDGRLNISSTELDERDIDQV